MKIPADFSLQPTVFPRARVFRYDPLRKKRGQRLKRLIVLLTTVPIRSLKEALCCLRWYTLRWRIEEWHRVMKSGCHIESHQHHTADRRARAICIDAVIAWRVMLLALLGREVPEMPCELMFSRWECSLLEKLQPFAAPETMTGKKTMHRRRDHYYQPAGGRFE